MPETVLDRIRACEARASRISRGGPSRRELRRLLRNRDLEVAAAILLLDRVAMLDPNRGPMDLHALVNDACATLQPFAEYVR